MGSKSSSVPAPDPRLVEAQIRSMGYQDDAIQQVMGLMQKQQAQNDELMPLQKQAMEFGLDANRTAFNQSQSDRGWLLDRRGALTGLQDQMIGEARDFNSAAAQDRAAGAAQAAVGQNLAASQQAAARSMASMGVAPDSGRMGAMLRKTGIEGARLGVGAANAARLDARNEGRMLTDRASNALAGYPAAAMGATGQGAGLAGNQLNIANSGAGGINAGYGAMTGAAQAAGGISGSMGGNAAGMYGTQASAKAAANAAEGEMWGSLLGAGATIGAAYI